MSENPFSDTIAAVATAAGRGAVALLRVSGPDAPALLLRLCPGLGAPPPPRTQTLAALRHPATGELLDRGLVCHFPAPHSYTGEQVVEITTHGGALTPQLVLDALLAAGARHAEPGEFTRRAYLNGKLDLLQAEAVLDLIDGRSRALHRAAVHQMERGLSRRVEQLRAALLGVEAMLAYAIDFPEEDEPPIPPERIATAAREALAQIRALLATAPEGELLREGALVVLAGRPNAGKSSLFNALLGMERAIVTEVPGTTRDALEAPLSVEGYPFRLVDTAGLRETADRVEGIGIEVARRYLQAAQLVLFCAEAGRALDAEERAFLAGLDAERTLLVHTKADEASAECGSRSAERKHTDEAAGGSALRTPQSALVSVVSGAGLTELRGWLLGHAFRGILGEPGEAPLVTRARQERALRAAFEEGERFLEALAAGVPMELAATHLRDAVARLEELIGVVSPDDVLGRVFGEFCVGK